MFGQVHWKHFTLHLFCSSSPSWKEEQICSGRQTTEVRKRRESRGETNRIFTYSKSQYLHWLGVSVLIGVGWWIFPKFSPFSTVLAPGIHYLKPCYGLLDTHVSSLGDQTAKWCGRVSWLFSCIVKCNCLCRNRANQAESSNDLFSFMGWLCCIECGNRR